MTTGGDFYNRLGVKRIINAASWITVYGGSIMPPAVVQAMDDASHWFVDMHELNEKAGNIIATLTGAEAGLVTAGSAAGMVLEAAATMAGSRFDRWLEATSKGPDGGMFSWPSIAKSANHFRVSLNPKLHGGNSHWTIRFPPLPARQPGSQPG